MAEPVAARPVWALAVTFFRFGIVGVINTGVGFATILALQFGLGLNPQLANAGGYALGLILSFTLNRRYVFGKGAGFARTAPRFLIAALAAFGLNQLVLLAARGLLQPDRLGAVEAQAVAAVSYTITFFALCRWWVFRAPQALRADG